MARKLYKELEERITSKVAVQDELIKELDDAKANVDTVLNDCILKMMTKDDIINNEKYRQYFIDNTGAIPDPTTGEYTIDDSLKGAWLNSKEMKDDRIERIKLAAEYSQEGRDGWIKKAKDAEQAKKDTKNALKIEGKRILDKLENLKLEFKEEIQKQENEIKANINSINKDINRINKDIRDANNNLLKAKKNKNQNEIDEFNKIITKYELEKKKEEEKLKEEEKKLKKLDNLKKQESIYEDAIDRAKHNFAKKLKDEAEIIIGVYKSKADEKVPDNGSESEQTIVTGNNTAQVDDRRSGKIADDEMPNFEDMSEAKINEMLNNRGYEYLLNLSRNTGFLNSEIVINQMTDMIEELDGDLEIDNGTKLSIEDLKNLMAIEDNKKIEAIRKTVNRYAEQYDDLKGYEQQKADKIMKYLKISIMLTEANTLKPSRWKLFRALSNGVKKSRINKIGNGLRDLAKKTERKARHKKKTIKELCKVYGYEVPESTPEKTFLYSDGKKPIQTQGREP